jgi:hypothetical protein
MMTALTASSELAESMAVSISAQEPQESAFRRSGLLRVRRATPPERS